MDVHARTDKQANTLNEVMGGKCEELRFKEVEFGVSLELA